MIRELKSEIEELKCQSNIKKTPKMSLQGGRIDYMNDKDEDISLNVMVPFLAKNEK